MGLKGDWLWIIMRLTLWMIVGLQVQSCWGCWEQERTSLLRLKPLFRPDAVASWKEDPKSDCCDDWAGVQCSTNRRVSSLILSQYYSYYRSHYLDWHFNASLLLPFEQLQELDLSYNSIVTWTEDTGLQKLERLELRGNYLSGIFLSNLSSLPSLKYLGIAENNLTGLVQLYGLQKLERLELSGNNLNSIILSNLRSLPSLKYLGLAYNRLPRLVQLRDIEAINKNLEELDLSGNDINGLVNYDGCGKMQKFRVLNLQNNGLANLPSCLGRLTSLQKLDISDNKFVGEIPPLLQSLTGLQTVDLSYNDFSGEIPSWMGSWQSLRSLNLTANHFTGNLASSPLIRLFSLEILQLSGNHFQIPHSFRPFANLTKLKYFDGGSNQVILDESEANARSFVVGFQLQVLILSNCGLTTYPPLLHLQYDLRLINLAGNSLFGDIPWWLLERNQRLDVIVLQNNSLAGVFKVPSFTHANISYIDIRENKLRGHLPENIGAVFPRLVILDMAANELNGNIPLNICDSKLQLLDLSHNRLSGGLRPLSMSCSNLFILSLSNNNFDRNLPSFYGLPSLAFLDLQENNLSGTIMANGFNPSLRVLKLRNNSLEGSIPKDLCSFYGPSVLDLSHNRLNGTLPSWVNSIRDPPIIRRIHLNDNRFNGHILDAFCNAYSLGTLDLSNNDLTGQIPTCIGNLTLLHALLLRGNQFQGQIPDQLCNLAGLSMLDLAYNNLSGPIPPCLSAICSNESDANADYDFFMVRVKEENVGLEYGEDEGVEFTTKGSSYTYSDETYTVMRGIDLSCNKLTGEVPPELGKLSNLHGLNLSHNMLWGVIPETFLNLTQLESLDLSYNNLNGQIPTQLTKLDTLAFFNVAYNNLSGEIPFEAHFTTFDASSYEGNPYLCGPPISKNCSLGKLPFIQDTNEFELKEVEDEEWIDWGIFYASFAGSGIVMFLAVLIIISGYYFLQDIIRKLRRVKT